MTGEIIRPEEEDRVCVCEWNCVLEGGARLTVITRFGCRSSYPDVGRRWDIMPRWDECLLAENKKDGYLRTCTYTYTYICTCTPVRTRSRVKHPARDAKYVTPPPYVATSYNVANPNIEKVSLGGNVSRLLILPFIYARYHGCHVQLATTKPRRRNNNGRPHRCCAQLQS